MTARLPTLFISHGSPMHAIEPGPVGGAWSALARALPRPKAILSVSAHWETNIPALTAGNRPETIHDFYGFPALLYQVQYRSPGAPDIALRAQALIGAAGIAVATDDRRGHDHGVWAPLLHMYPEQDIPVAELSVQPGRDPAHHLAVGRALAPLADDGVLVIGSGHMTHNLRDWDRRHPDATAVPYVREFRDWVHQRIETGDHEALAGYRRNAPHAVRAHPSEEHFLPLFVALGAAGEGAQARRLWDGVEGGALAMDLYAFGAH